MTMDPISADLLIHIISYLNVVDAASFGTTSRRMHYLVHQYQHAILGPQLAACSSKEGNDIYSTCLKKLFVKPNLALAFNTGTPRGELSASLRECLPGDAVALGAVSSSVQVNLDDQVQCDLDSALMMGTLIPERTTMIPFESPEGDEVDKFLSQLVQATPTGFDAACYWKVFIVYVCGSGYYGAESFVSSLQAAHPDAAIVGGICDGGFVSQDTTLSLDELQRKTTRELKRLLTLHGGNDDNLDFRDKNALCDRVMLSLRSKKYNLVDIEDGIFGIGLGGDVPVRSIVSRGVKSLTRPPSAMLHDTGPQWFVSQVELCRPQDESYPFRGDEDLLKPVHSILKLRDSESERVIEPGELLANLDHQPEFVGIQRPGADGFELNGLNPFSLQRNCILLMTDGSPEQEQSLQDSRLDFFTLDAQACLDHMDMTLGKLLERTKDEVILGGVLFSCNGRGPSRRSILQREMADAKLFHKYFPSTTLCGFYAGGEIGPVALTGNKNIFQKGKAAVQGFTAVIVLFIVPSVEPGSYQLDDSDENVALFLQSKQE